MVTGLFNPAHRIREQKRAVLMDGNKPPGDLVNKESIFNRDFASPTFQGPIFSGVVASN